MRRKTLRELTSGLDVEIIGDIDCPISGIATIEQAKAGDITFMYDSAYRRLLSNTKASALILPKEYVGDCQTNMVVSANPQYIYSKIAQHFAASRDVEPGIHETAVIGKDAVIDPSAAIGANVVVGDRVAVAKGVVIAANSVIGDDAVIQEGSQVAANVTIGHAVQVGKFVTIDSGAVIGSEGFGLAKKDGKWHRIPHLGTVIVGDHVGIGANTTVDRGAIADTIIENGVKLDNLIHVAHNVTIGQDTAIAACTGIAGSTKIGKNCSIGGGCGIGGHLSIADDTIVTGMAMVTNSLTKPGLYSSGTGIFENRVWRKLVARLRHLEELVQRVKGLERLINNKD